MGGSVPPSRAKIGENGSRWIACSLARLKQCLGAFPSKGRCTATASVVIVRADRCLISSILFADQLPGLKSAPSCNIVCTICLKVLVSLEMS